MRKIQDTSYFSKLVGRLPEGCRLCVQGRKLVLFVTGLCPRRCFYCPLSERRRWKDVVVANEWWIKKPSEILEEARLCEAQGAGITGGDPLIRLERTLRYIRMLKREFGRDFHIHLYTPSCLATERNLARLDRAGLDEIRFHPENKDWSKISDALKFDWAVGCEIPAVPGREKEARELIDFIDEAGASFININELEISETNQQVLARFGLYAIDDESSAAGGSRKTALRLLDYCARETGLNAHYCTVKLKDRIQVGRRIKRRARNVRKPYDIVDDEGILLRGAVYLPDLTPSFNYKRTLEEMGAGRRRKLLSELCRLKHELKRIYCIPERLLEVDERRLRVLLAPWVLEQIAGELKEKKLKPALVREYPTWDALITELEYI